MTAWVYCRVSTGEQARSGISLQSQAEKCLAFVRSRPQLTLGSETNCGEPGVFLDESSAYKIPISQRAGGSKLISLLEPGDTIVLYDIVRGWRSLLDFSKSVQKWVNHGISISFVSYPSLDLGTANGRLTAAVMAAYAEWKSAITSERVREANAIQKGSPGERGRDRDPGPPLRVPRQIEATASPAPVVATGDSLKSYAREHAAVVSAISPELAEDRQEPTDRSEGCSVFGYVRVSTDRQSVESQIEPVERYIDNLTGSLLEKHTGVRVSMHVDHGVSAYKQPFESRRSSGHILQNAEKGDHVVFLRPARAFRSIRDMLNVTATLQDRGVAVHLAESGIQSGDLAYNMMMQIMTLMAQIESEEGARRTRDSNAWMLEHGFIPGSKANIRWIKKVSIDGTHTHFVPDRDYLADCKRILRLTERFGRKEAFRRMEIVCARRENRPPFPDSGISGSLLYQRSRAGKVSLGEAWWKISGENNSRDVTFFPTHRVRDYQRIRTGVQQYHKYLAELSSSGNLTVTAKAISGSDHRE